MSARVCSECPRPVGVWRKKVCSDPCGAERERRLSAEWNRLNRPRPKLRCLACDAALVYTGRGKPPRWCAAHKPRPGRRVRAAHLQPTSGEGSHPVPTHGVRHVVHEARAAVVTKETQYAQRSGNAPAPREDAA